MSKRCLSSGSLDDGASYNIILSHYYIHYRQDYLGKEALRGSSCHRKALKSNTREGHTAQCSTRGHAHAQSCRLRGPLHRAAPGRPGPARTPALSPYGSAVPASARGGRQLRAALMAAAASPLSSHRPGAAIFPARPPNAFRVGAAAEAERPCRGCLDHGGGRVQAVVEPCLGRSPMGGGGAPRE